MAQTRPGRIPEAGRPRGAVWRALVGEGITWEGQVIISGEHADLDARMIVTGTRVVFVRGGTIALDARREWLDPAPVMGRGGRVSLWISTPGGSGPIPIEIRSRDGQFGATRLVTRLMEGQPTGVDSGHKAPVIAPPVVEPVAAVEESRQVEHPEPWPARPVGFGAVPVAEPSAPAVPSAPSFGYNPAPTRSSRLVRPIEPPIATDATGRDRFSVESINRAFGASSLRPTDVPSASPSPSGSDPSLAGRWSLSSELLARTVAPADRAAPEASPDRPVSPVDGALASPSSGSHHAPSRAAASTMTSDTPSVEPVAPDRAAPSGSVPAGLPPLPLSPLSATPNLPQPIAAADRPRPTRDEQGRSLRADPVPHARTPESPNRSMLPGLPAGTPVSLAASERDAVSAAPSGRRAGNSVITARSSAAARQSAKQAAAGTASAEETFPSAVALASARAGLPLAPMPAPVPGAEVPVLTGDDETPGRRSVARRLLSGRVMWGATAALLVALTVAAGLYLALGLPEGDGDGGLIGGAGETTSSDDGSVAILAATPAASSSVSSVAPSTGIAAGPPTPTATAAVPRGVGGIGESIPTREPTAGASASSEASATVSASSAPVAATEPAPSQAVAPTATVVDPSPTVATAPTSATDDVSPAGDDASAAESVAESAAPSESPPVSPSASVSASASVSPAASVAPDTSASPSASPSASNAASPSVSSAGSASAGPSASSEASASSEPSPSAPDEPSVSAGTSPSSEPTPGPTVTSGPTPTPGPDVAPQDATVDDDGRPQQVFTVGSVRYTIESVAAGATIPEINQPQSPFGGDWLAVVLAADNWGVGDAIVDMTQFTATVAPSGETRRLDSYSQVVAQRLGFPVVAGATDQFAIAPGGTVRIGLLYLTDADATNFVLNAGTTTVDLTAAFNSSLPMNQLGELPAAPELLEATVTNVIDAVTIEVEIDGETVPVRYSGMIAPAVESCVSGEATLANRDLVNGQTVWLERQNANVDSDGVWLRDVWVEDDSGSLELVAAVLAGDGIADADIQRPNSRYAAWVETAAYIAQLQSVGLWAPCEG